MTRHAIAVRIRCQDPFEGDLWAEVRRNLALADLAAAASKVAATRRQHEAHLQTCLYRSTRALLQASRLLGEQVGTVSELRSILQARSF